MSHVHLAEHLFDVLQQAWPEAGKVSAWQALRARFNFF